MPEAIDHITHDERREADRQAPLRMAFLGLCFSRIWTYTFMIALALPASMGLSGLPGIPADMAGSGEAIQDVLSIVFFGAGALFALLSAGLPLGHRPSKRPDAARSKVRHAYAWLALTFGLVSATALALATCLEAPWLYGIATMIGGMTLAVLRLAWGHIYSRIDKQELGTYTSASFLVAIAVVAVLKLLPHEVAPWLLLALPVGASWCLYVAQRHVEGPEAVSGNRPREALLENQRGPGDSSAAERAEYPFWPLAAGMFIFVLASATLTTMFGANTDSQLLASWKSVIVDALVAIIFVGLYIAKRTMNALAVYRFVLPLMALGYVLFPLVPGQHQAIGAIVASVGYGLFDLLSWIVMAQHAHDNPSSARHVFGLGVGVTLLGRTLGSICGPVLLHYQQTGLFPLSSVSIIMLFVLLIVCLTILPEKFFSHQQTTPGDPQANESEQAGIPAPATINPLVKGCESLAMRAQLTSRETDVLMWLARGRNAAAIAEALGIAHGTAQTHIKHIYAKTGLHNQQELMKTVEEAGSEPDAPIMPRS